MKRFEYDLKQEAVAEKLGIPLANYNKKENGKVQFSDIEKIKLISILKMSSEEFDNIFFNGSLSKTMLRKATG